ncbi:hypothetical protein M0811_13815 [Anaeramoeba ignava]|uniref:Fibronectin type-III domain-containing protein n=1 Tax=Anaeramoeba ignava TaxID=1746090 RepID=A0A9Q0LXL9_ANAIG|nr:hypothetical protein M0811_13815 [Anaeramoeba ignava]
MKTSTTILFITLLFLVSFAQNEEIPKPKLIDGDYVWTFCQKISSNDSSETFGYSVDLSDDYCVIGDPSQQKIIVHKLEQNYWDYLQTMTESYSSFGWSVGIGNNSSAIIVGAPDGKTAFTYKFENDLFAYDSNYSSSENPSSFGGWVAIADDIEPEGDIYVIGDTLDNQLLVSWENETVLDGEPGENLGFSVAISSDGSTIAGSTDDTNNLYLYQLQQGLWTRVANLGSYFNGYGNDITMSSNGDVIIVAAMLANVVSVWRILGETWNIEQNLYVGDCNFGSSVAVSQDGTILVVGANLTNSVYVYNYSSDSQYWYQVQSISGPDGFGTSVAISGDYLLVSAPYSNEVQFYHLGIPGSEIVLVNCTPSFSGFACYWQQPENNFSLHYQIDFGAEWINITDPFFDVETDLFYYVFNSSNFPFMIGNQEYSFNLRACDSTGLCGSLTPTTRITTGIGAVTNFSVITTPYSIELNWQPPNVAIYNGIPNIYKYIVMFEAPGWGSYDYLENTATSSEYSSLDPNTGYWGNVYACKTYECEGYDQGEVVGYNVTTGFGQVGILRCSVSNVLDISCVWFQCTGFRDPTYYNVTYQSQSFGDEKVLQTTSTEIDFSVHLPNQTYQINVSACDSNYQCGAISTVEINTTNISSPNITDSVSGIEQLEIIFTKVTQAKSYLVSINKGNTWANFTSMKSNGSEITGTITGLQGNVVYNVSVRGCSEISCAPEYLGLISEVVQIRTKLGNITSFNCNPIICGFECNWDPLTLADGLQSYSFTYNTESLCLDKSATSRSVSELLGGEDYQISIFACDSPNCESNGYSGISASTWIKTDYIPAPSIIQSNSKIEEVEIIFTSLAQAKSYLVSIDGKISWRNFTTLNPNGNEMIGTINELAGNVEYYIAIRGCSDLNCTLEFAGIPNSPILIKPKLGNITSFNCNPIICGFECNWDLMELSSGLRGYGITYNSKTICFAKSMNQISIFNLIGGENYEISIFASSDWRCETNEYSGLPSTVSITTLAPTTQETSESSSDIKVIVPAVIVPIVVIAIIIIVIMWIRHRSKKPKKEDNSTTKEMELSDDV